MARAEVKSPKIFMSDPYQQLIDDLVAEQRYLDGQLADLPDEIWQNDTPCRGWMVRDVIAHLAEVDESATNVATGALKSMSGGDRSEDGTRSALQDSSRHMTRTQLVDWWRAARDRMEIALRARDGRDRLPWAGPPMSARSFATARLMECWSHGLDALDGASVEPIHSDRLQHIAHLGYIATVRLPDAWPRAEHRTAERRADSALRRTLVARRPRCAERHLRHGRRLLPSGHPTSLQGHRPQLHLRSRRGVSPGRPNLRRPTRRPTTAERLSEWRRVRRVADTLSMQAANGPSQSLKRASLALPGWAGPP